MSEELSQLLSLIERTVHEGGFDQPHTMIYVEDFGDGSFDLGTKLLAPNVHPSDELFGFVAPDAWTALGVIAHGNARHIEGGPPRRCRTSLLVHRSGEVTSVLRMQGEDPSSMPAPGGFITDLIHRALGLPTAGPDTPVGELIARRWLTQVCTAGRHATGPLSWRFIDGLRSAAPPLTSWEELRWQVVTGTWEVPWCGADDAAWLDDGSFARLADSEVPPLQHLLVDVARVVTQPTMRLVVSATDEATDLTGWSSGSHPSQEGSESTQGSAPSNDRR